MSDLRNVSVVSDASDSLNSVGAERTSPFCLRIRTGSAQFGGNAVPEQDATAIYRASYDFAGRTDETMSYSVLSNPDSQSGTSDRPRAASTTARIASTTTCG